MVNEAGVVDRPPPCGRCSDMSRAAHRVDAGRSDSTMGAVTSTSAGSRAVRAHPVAAAGAALVAGVPRRVGMLSSRCTPIATARPLGRRHCLRPLRPFGARTLICPPAHASRAIPVVHQIPACRSDHAPVSIYLPGPHDSVCVCHRSRAAGVPQHTPRWPLAHGVDGQPALALVRAAIWRPGARDPLRIA